MKTLLNLFFLAVFMLSAILSFGHDDDKTKKASKSPEKAMHISLEDFPTDMGINHINGWGGMTVGVNEFPAGVDFAPMLEGLKNNSCQVPHWGLVLEGKVRHVYDDGTEAILKKGDLFYMPPGHNLIILENSKILEFSPQEEFHALLQHVQKKMAAAQENE